MLAFAREKATLQGLSNVEFRCIDAEKLDVPDASFDALTCRWGIMFMPDPVEALRRARAALRGGSRVAVATWANPQRNPFASVPLSVVRRHIDLPTPPPGTPGIFAFADPARLRSTVEEAGFSDVAVEEVEVTFMEVESGAAYWNIMRDIAGPIIALIGQLPEAERERVHTEICEAAEALRVGDRVIVKGVSLVASGRC